MNKNNYNKNNNNELKQVYCDDEDDDEDLNEDYYEDASNDNISLKCCKTNKKKVYGKNKVIYDETFDEYKEYLKNPKPFKPYLCEGYMGQIRENNFSQLVECVLTVSKLPEILNNEYYLFNLFCQYGNCLRIKKHQQGFYIQMADGFQSYVAQKYINSIMAFDSTINIYYTKYLSLSGGIDFKQFNRFIDPNEFKLNYGIGFSKPTNQLYVKNLPKLINEEYLLKIFKDHSPHLPIDINIQSDGNNKTNHGLLDFKDTISATESLIIMNNTILSKKQQLLLSFYTK